MFAAMRALTTRAFSPLVDRASLLAPPVVQQIRSMAIHKLTRLNIIDNSGARIVRTIDHFARKPARVGDVVRVVVQKAAVGGRVSKKDILAAVICRQRAIRKRADGTTLRFHENAAVLLKRDGSAPIGTRVSGPVARELRAAKFAKVVMMASRVV